MNKDPNEKSTDIDLNARTSKSKFLVKTSDSGSDLEPLSATQVGESFPELQEALKQLSLTTNQENHFALGNDPDTDISDKNFQKENSQPHLTQDENLHPLNNVSETACQNLGNIQILNRIDVIAANESLPVHTKLVKKNDEPVMTENSLKHTELKASPESTNLIVRDDIVTEQPRTSRYDTEQIYVSRNPMKESASNVHLGETQENRFKPPASNIPPSYSTVIKFPPPELRRPPLLDSNFSFSRRIPPPSYAQVQGLWTESASTRSSEEVLYGPEPQYAECPRCTVIVITETRCGVSKLTHFTALGLCLLGCWPCCLLPYFMESCKDTYHYCPVCHHCFGMYTPW